MVDIRIFESMSGMDCKGSSLLNLFMMNMKETINDFIGQSKNDGIQEFQKYNFFLPFTLVLMDCFFALAQKVCSNSDHWPNIASHNINIQKTKIMASGPITSWEIDGETVETVSDFIFLGSKITADGDCSEWNHYVKHCCGNYSVWKYIQYIIYNVFDWRWAFIISN